MHRLRYFHLFGHLISFSSIRVGVAKPQIRVARSFRCLGLGPSRVRGHVGYSGGLEWSAPMNITVFTEEVEVPDFFAYEILLPQLLDTFPGTKCMSADDP
jgi:hypothetical protein